MSQNVLRTLHQQLPQHTVAAFGDAQLRRALARVAALRPQSHAGTGVPAAPQPLRIVVQVQHERQGRDRPHPVGRRLGRGALRRPSPGIRRGPAIERKRFVAGYFSAPSFSMRLSKQRISSLTCWITSSSGSIASRRSSGTWGRAFFAKASLLESGRRSRNFSRFRARC